MVGKVKPCTGFFRLFATLTRSAEALLLVAGCEEDSAKDLEILL